MKQLYKRVFSLSSVYAFGNMSQNALSIFLLPLYTSYLYPKDYGILALMSLIVLIATRAIVTPLDFERFYYKPGFKENNGTLIFNMFCLLILKLTLLSLIYWECTELICRIVFKDTNIHYIVKLYTILIFFSPVQTFLQKLIRLREMAKYYVAISLSNLILSTGLTVFLMVKLNLGVLSIIYSNIFGLIFVSLLCFPVFLKNCTFRFSFSILKEPLKYGYPLTFTGYSNILIQSGDRYVLSLLGTLSTVGVYNFGYKISSLINMALVEPLKQGMRPLIHQKEDDPIQQKKFIIALTDYYYIVGIFMSLGLSLFSKEVIMLLARKEEFWASWVIIPFISFSYVQHGLGNTFAMGLLMKNKSFYLSKILLMSAAVNIGLNFLFIPYWGIIGAAIATVISYFVWNSAKLYYSAKFYDLHFNLGRLFLITLLGLALYLPALVFANSPSILLNLTIKFFMLSLYPIILLNTKFFTPHEKKHIRKMVLKYTPKGLGGIFKSAPH